MKHMRSIYMLLAVCGIASLGLAGCGIGKAIGVNKSSPDEFAVVTKAPLVIPPDYALHPPAPGSTNGPQTEADLIAQKAILGDAQAFTPGMSSGERALVEKAGATQADPLIRQVVDQEYASLVHRGDEFSNRLIFWGQGKPSGQTSKSAADSVDGQPPVSIKK